MSAQKSGGGGLDALSVFDAEVNDAIGKRPPAAPKAAAAERSGTEPEQAPAPAQRREVAPRRRQGAPTRRTGAVGSLAALPMPERLDTGTTKPLNVRVPGHVHFQMKLTTTALGLDMQDVVGSLVTLFTHDAELVARLMRQAADEGVTLGELLHEAMLGVES